MKPYSDRARDAGIASDAARDREQACSAQGCPMTWCVDMGHGRLCGHHDKTEPRDWPGVTQWLLDRETQRAMRPQEPERPRTFNTTPEQRRALLQRLSAVMRQMASGDALSGARSLRDREQSGERLTLAQRQFWRQALRIRGEREEREDRDAELRFADANADQARRVVEYAEAKGIAL